jgi:hypothetical protein
LANKQCAVVTHYFLGPHFVEKSLTAACDKNLLENDLPPYLGNALLATRIQMWILHGGAFTLLQRLWIT